MIMRSTQLTEAIARTEETVDKMASNPQRRGIFGILMTQRSGARFTAPQGMICKSARLFCIARRCHHHQRRGCRSHGESISTG
jgi:hypothetical protein